MTDIRKVCKVFLDFVYDNNVLPKEFVRILKENDAEWDIRKICQLLGYYNNDNVFKEKEARGKLNIELKKQLEKTPFYKFSGVDNWLKRSASRFKTIVDDLNEYFHDVSQEAYMQPCIDNMVAAIRESMKRDTDYYTNKISELKTTTESKSSEQYETLLKEKDEQIKSLNEQINYLQKSSGEKSKDKGTPPPPTPIKKDDWPFKSNKKGIKNFCACKNHSLHEFVLGSPQGEYYWANANLNVVQQKWTIVLNDYYKRILHIIDIPANVFELSRFRIKDSHGIKKIDLNISVYKLIDRDSLYDFSKYNVTDIPYTDEDIEQFDIR